MSDRFTSYQKKLFVFLSVATFFEGYDFLALAQILPNLRAEFGLSKLDAGLLFGFVNAGTIVAWFVVRRADIVGRRKMLMITILGYTLTTFLSGLASNVYVFAGLQFLARMFLIGEWAIASMVAAEEYPAARRGMVIGVLQAFSSLGAIVCAGVVPLLLSLPWGWRTVYFVGVVPLLLLAVARRGLKETRRFEARAELERNSPFVIWSTPHRKRVIQMGVIWFITYACSNTAVSFWKEFAVGERGMTDGDVALALTIAAVGSMPMVFYAGRLLDVLGRRGGAAVIFIATAAGVLGAYGLESKWALIAALTVAIFGVSAVLPVLNAFTAELFPTEYRGDGYAWANNLIGRLGFVLTPVAIGAVAEQLGWGAAIRPTAIFPIVALGLILWLLPETNALELEESSLLH